MNIDEEFAQRREEQQRQLARQPQGERPDITSPELEDQFESIGPETDKRLADAFINRYRHLFCNGDGRLYVYMANAGRWMADKFENYVFSLVMCMSNDYHRERIDLLSQLEAAVRDGLAEEGERLARRRDHLNKLIAYCEKAATIGSVTRLVIRKLEGLLVKDPVTMNPDPYMLACRNGVVDLRTGRLMWPTIEDRLTLNTTIDYVPNGGYEWWASRVREIAGADDIAEYLQVWFGYCATGITREHCMAVMWGNGRNGKSLVMEAVAKALGPYAIALASSFLESQDRVEVGNNVLYMMAQLHGKRMAYVSETGEKGKLRESLVKSLTGDKTIRARMAHQDYFEFEVTHKFVIGTNHKPEITGTDDGVWARIRLIPTRIRFGTEAEVAAGVAQYLKRPQDMAYLDTVEGREEVLRWIVAGACKYAQHGLQRYTPVTVVAETLGYRREQDVLGQFLQSVSEPVALEEITRMLDRVGALRGRQFESVTDADMLQVDKMELWRTYALWAAENGHGVMSSTMFARRITSTQRFWPGDGSGEILMKPLEALRTNRGHRYRFFRFNDFGKRLRDHAAAEYAKRQGTPADE